MGAKEYFELGIEELQALGRWAGTCASRALQLYEAKCPGDPRPRKAIEGIVEFSRSGKRTNKLRKLALDAYRASLETVDEAAKAAARASSLAAASAYTHPFRDVRQAEHILGPAAYAALAMELKEDPGNRHGDEEVRLAIENAELEVAELLGKMPERGIGKTRIDRLLFDLDHGLRENLKQKQPSALTREPWKANGGIHISR